MSYNSYGLYDIGLGLYPFSINLSYINNKKYIEIYFLLKKNLLYIYIQIN